MNSRNDATCRSLTKYLRSKRCACIRSKLILLRPLGRNSGRFRETNHFLVKAFALLTVMVIDVESLAKVSGLSWRIYPNCPLSSLSRTFECDCRGAFSAKQLFSHVNRREFMKTAIA